LALSACASDTIYLPALVADPMASYEAEGVELVEKHTQEQGETAVIGGTVVARVILRYEVDEQDAESALADAVAFAGENGWDMSPVPIPGVTDERFVGEKDLSVGLARMILAIDRRDAAPANSGMVGLGITMGFDHLDEES
jgi:hypothetical protein